MNIAPDKIPATLVPSSDVTKKCGLCHRGHIIYHPLGAGKLYKIGGSYVQNSEQIGGRILLFIDFILKPFLL